MNVDIDDFRRHYAALSEQALLDLNPEDLTDVARQCYEVELSHRGLKRAVRPKTEEAGLEELQMESAGPRLSTEHPAWTSSAVSAAEFEYAEEAEQARDVLEQAAIPCVLMGKHQDPSLGNSRKYRGKWIALMVPQSFLETARQRLQTEFYEPSSEDDYAKHFVEFSDDELSDVDIQTIPETGRKWYSAELERRGLEPRPIQGTPDPPSALVGTEDGFVPVATLLEEEANAANRVLETASIPCRLERDAPQGDFESFAILVPASYLDQASDILNRHQGEIFRRETTDDKVDDRS